MSNRIQLDYDGFVIGAQGASADDTEWLREFLEPQFSLTHGGRCDVEVSFEVGAEPFERLRARSEITADEEYDAFVLDTSTLRHARCAPADSPADVRLALDTQRDVFFEVGPGPRVRVVCRDHHFSRIAWMRVIREFAMHALLRRGDVFLHAACFSLEDRGVLIAGVKEAGKTTTLTWCLQLLEKARFVANDRVHVRATGPGYEARGMPTVMTLRPGTLALLPEFASRVATSAGNHRLSARERAARGSKGPPRVWDDGRIGMGPADYKEILGREAAASGRAAAIVFPEVVSEPNGLSYAPLDEREARKRIEAALFGAMDLHRRSQLFDAPDWGPFPSADTIRARAGEIVERVPAYTWRVGNEAPRDLTSLESFLEQLD